MRLRGAAKVNIDADNSSNFQLGFLVRLLYYFAI